MPDVYSSIDKSVYREIDSTGERPAFWWRSRIIICRRGSASAWMGSIGAQRTGIRGIGRSVYRSHVERLNGAQRHLLKRLNRLTPCFSKKLRNLDAAFAMFAAYHNYCWRTRKPGKTGKNRPTAAMMARLTDRLWGFDEFFDAVLRPATRR